MKNIFLVVPLLVIIAFYAGCSDDSTSSTTKSSEWRYSKIESNDTLIIDFTAKDTAITFTDNASLSQFSSIPKIYYKFAPTEGFGDFSLFNALDTNIFFKHFTGFVEDTFQLNDIPRRYVLSITGYTGSGTIRVTK